MKTSLLSSAALGAFGDFKNKVSISTLAITLVGTLFTASVCADNAHFVKANGTINNDGEYVASFKEAGLGSGQTINYELTAGTGTQFVYQCYTKSNNQPHGAPNTVSPTGLVAKASIPVGKNGAITASLTLTPAPDAGCQGNGLKLCLDSVSYQNVVLTDTTQDPDLSIDLPSLDRNFVVNGRPTNC